MPGDHRPMPPTSALNGGLRTDKPHVPREQYVHSSDSSDECREAASRALFFGHGDFESARFQQRMLSSVFVIMLHHFGDHGWQINLGSPI